eukprot:CAMPEP_0170903944 /NCGR_PEP_ID=MMETSP0734-20130129/50131_1 /TAXON_ID=186038 /ORGANISM="Fragilariopsis kerguelensis, Strain L26-C5" /LENGTH=101 /DNA_ID=CAMNT_0011299353 /DNA_START=111 /DNA_END=413 /DNA_ORIENTATION=+
MKCVIDADDRGGVTLVVAAARLPKDAAPFELLAVPKAVPNEEECVVPERVELIPLPTAPNPPAAFVLAVARPPKVLGAPFPDTLMALLAKAPNLLTPPEVA